MAKKSDRATGGSTPNFEAGPASVREGKTSGRGREWIIEQNGRTQRVVTSPASARAIDGIGTRRHKLLKRLADK